MGFNRSLHPKQKMASLDGLDFLGGEGASFSSSSLISMGSAPAARLLDLLASELDACVLVLDGVRVPSKFMEARKASAALRLGLVFGLGSEMDEVEEDVREDVVEVSVAEELSGWDDEMSWGGVGARSEPNEEAGGVSDRGLD